MERLGKIGRNQQRKVGVVRPAALVCVAVAVDHRDSVSADAALVMLLAHDSARVHAEGAHLALKGIGVIYELCFVQVGGQRVHHRVRHLDAHADVYRVVCGGDPVLRRNAGQPVRTAAAGGQNNIRRRQTLALALLIDCPHAGGFAVFILNCFGGRVFQEREILFCVQVIIHAAEYLVGILGSHMANGTGHQLNVMLFRVVCDLIREFVAQTVYGFRRAEAQVDSVCVMDQVGYFLARQVIGHIAAHLVRKRKLAVGKGAGSGPSVHNMAGVAVGADSSGSGRTGPARNGAAAVDHQNFCLRSGFFQLQRCKNACRAGPHDNYVVLKHELTS